jgi:hypothetical protein
MHPHAVAGTMESIRTPSPPADARAPHVTPRGADGDIEGLEPALSDVLTPSKEDAPPKRPTPGRRLAPVKFSYGSSNLPQPAPKRAMASPPPSPALKETPSNASQDFDGVLARGQGEDDPFARESHDHYAVANADSRSLIPCG